MPHDTSDCLKVGYNMLPSKERSRSGSMRLRPALGHPGPFFGVPFWGAIWEGVSKYHLPSENPTTGQGGACFGAFGGLWMPGQDLALSHAWQPS